MNEQVNDDRLIQRLKAAAASDAPRFSAALHEKIMRRIESATIERAPERRFNWMMPLSLAAMVLLCVGTFVFLSHRSPLTHGTEIARGNVPSMPAISNPVAALDQTVATDWPDNRYASLDQDGQRFLNFMARQLDVAPSVRR
jgi:hypothetical protein